MAVKIQLLVNVIHLALLSVLPVVTSQSDHQQSVLFDGQSHNQPSTKQIAIIGAGSAGASTAYYLHKFANDANQPINITVFDRNGYVGGRSTTVQPFNDSMQPAIELGASIFVAVNHNLVSAVQELNLSRSVSSTLEPLPHDPPALGIYDGTNTILQLEGGGGWRDTLRMAWKYGLAPLKTISLTERTVDKFLKMYSAPFFPFASITDTVHELELADATGVTGSSWLHRWGIGDSFANDVVQAATRVNYAQNLDEINGMSAMVCMAADNAMSIEGGNWRIFDAMIKASGARSILGANVTSIDITNNGKASIQWKQIHSDKDRTVEDERYDNFDDVVIAAPFHQTGIKINEDLEHVPEDIQFVNLQVTLLASKHMLDPAAFNLKPEDLVPRTVLTTWPRKLQENDHLPDFFSISTLRQVFNPQARELNYVYKIFSRQVIDDAFLQRILGLPGGMAVGEDDVSWVYRKVWQSYPYEKPRDTFDELLLLKNIWYSGAIESFISTMETSSLMGSNIARLMVDSWPEQRPTFGTSA